MKRYRIIIYLVIALGAVYLMVDSNTFRKDLLSKGMYVSYNNLTELSTSSELIIIGEPITSKKEKSPHNHVTNVRIKKILSNHREEQWLVGDVISITEPNYITNNPWLPGKTMNVQEHYKEMEIGNDYILFLNQNQSFYINSFSFGQYPLNDEVEEAYEEVFPENRQLIKKELKKQYERYYD